MVATAEVVLVPRVRGGAVLHAACRLGRFLPRRARARLVVAAARRVRVELCSEAGSVVLHVAQLDADVEPDSDPPTISWGLRKTPRRTWRDSARDAASGLGLTALGRG